MTLRKSALLYEAIWNILVKVFAHYSIQLYYIVLTRGGETGNWDFRISDLLKNPDGTDI